MAQPRPLVGLFSGFAAGLLASAAMAVVRRNAPRLLDGPGASEPAGALPTASDEAAPLLVGAALGGLYGLITEYQPEASAGFGTAFGTAAGALIDEAAPAAVTTLPALVEPPKSELAATAVSHLVYGMVLEGVRTLIAGRR